MKSCAPIILFVYKRPEHTKKTIEFLKQNTLASESDLYVFSEFQRSPEFAEEVNTVREYITTIEGFRSVSIIERPHFLGLAKSVISGVTEVFQKHDRVIVLEDDIITAPFFLEYMNEALDKYENDARIFSVTGFCYPPNLMKIYDEYKHDVLMLPRASSWGWGTWKNRWEKADWEVKDYSGFYASAELQKKYDQTGGDKSRMLIKQQTGVVDSWAIRWDYTHYKNNAYGVFPRRSLINNIGLDNSGSHTKNLKSHANEISSVKPVFPGSLDVDDRIIDAYRAIYKRGGYIFKAKQFVKRLFSK